MRLRVRATVAASVDGDSLSVVEDDGQKDEWGAICRAPTQPLCCSLTPPTGLRKMKSTALDYRRLDLQIKLALADSAESGSNKDVRCALRFVAVADVDAVAGRRQ